MDNLTAETHTPLFNACLVEAAAGGRQLMEKMAAGTRDGLQHDFARTAPGPAREALTELLRQLNRHEETLCSLYPDELLAEFSGTGSSARSKAAVSAPSFDELELMDESQVQESVELARAQQAAQVATDAPLAAFNALMCGAQGLKTVQPDRNPARPEVYVRALRSVLLKCGAPASARLRWLQYMGAVLGRELADVYVHLTIRLREGGVTPAGYVVTQTPSAGAAVSAAAAGMATGGGRGQAGSGGGGGAAPAPAVGAASGSREQTLLTVNQLRKLLAGELDGAAIPAAGAASGGSSAASSGGAAPASRSDFNFTVPAAFEALQEMKQVDKVMQRLTSRAQPGAAGLASPAGPGGTAAALAALREQLRTDARGVGQSLGLEVVNLMVENIAGDRRLLPPVQQAVRTLEPALLRLALIDPRFFSDKLHPARRLLEQMTQRSLAWQDAGNPAFVAFMEPLDQAVQVLAGMPIMNPEPFDFALRTLLEAWGEQQRSERRQRETAVKSLLQAEQRNLLAAKIAREISSREDALQAPNEILTFLTGPWAQVMAQARLSDHAGTPDPGGYANVINDLIWSAQPDLARNSIPRLTRLIPSLLATLRDGLASIEYPKQKTSEFFEELMVQHQQALRPQAAAAGQPGASTGSQAMPQAPAPAAQRATRAELEARFGGAGAEPWLAPAEAQESGFMDSGMLESRASRPPAFAPTQPGFGDTQPFAPSQRSAAATAGMAEEVIPAGAWVEFLVGDRATRTQLTWASPHGTLFMFTNAEGGSHSMTRRSLDKLLADGGLRVISDHAVVDEALDAVAQAAMRNSLDVTL
ncbi:MAG: DUF1631 family protein [Pseudomonadota bacterium]